MTSPLSHPKRARREAQNRNRQRCQAQRPAEPAQPYVVVARRRVVGADQDLLDKNFAVHLPVLDRLFGTYYLPKGVWPTSYGVIGGAASAKGYLGQLIQPFLPVKRS